MQVSPAVAADEKGVKEDKWHVNTSHRDGRRKAPNSRDRAKVARAKAAKRQRDGAKRKKKFDSTLGYPGEGPTRGKDDRLAVTRGSRGGSKHPKDVARDATKRRVTKRFDSTLGFPGEGPSSRDDRLKVTRGGRGGAQHPRDVARDARKKRRFDSTMGFPGEGPERKHDKPRDNKWAKPALVCHNCGKVGHKKAVCRNASQPHSQQNPNPPDQQRDQARRAQGKSADDAIRDIEREDGKRSGGEGAAEEKKIDPAVVRAKIVADIYSKATTMLLTKDLASEHDRNVVIRAMTAIARKEQLHARGEENVSGVVMEIYNRAMVDVLNQRTNAYRRLAVHKYENDDEEDFKSLSELDEDLVGKTPLHKLNTISRVEPFSMVAVGRRSCCRRLWQWFVGAFAAVVPIFALFAWVLVEEFVKHAPEAPFFILHSEARFGIALLVCAAMASFEVRTMSGWRLPLALVARFLAHAALATIPLIPAIFLHSVWNVLMYCLSVSWMLDMREVDLTADEPVIQDICCDEFAMKT